VGQLVSQSFILQSVSHSVSYSFIQSVIQSVSQSVDGLVDSHQSMHHLTVHINHSVHKSGGILSLVACYLTQIQRDCSLAVCYNSGIFAVSLFPC